MKRSRLRRAAWPAALITIGLAVFGGTLTVRTQPREMPPVPIQYVEARTHLVGRSIQLPGVVEARASGQVAAEIAGRIASLRVREGDTVRKGQELARVRRKTIEFELEEARAALAESEARKKLAERRRQRSQELYDEKIISDSELDDSTTELNAWQARVTQSATRIERLEDQLARTSIRAPFAGVIVRRFKETGEWLDVGDPVVELMSLTQLEVVVPVPEKYFELVSVGEKARVTFESLPGHAVDGRVRAIVPRTEEQARSFPVRIEVKNADRKIAVGMLARVGLPTSDSRPGVIVPKDAIVGDPRSPAVFVVGDEDKVQRVEVSLGRGIAEWVEVEGNVEASQRIVVRGNERLFPGQAVVPERIEVTQP